ncbi:uncharacterized protein LOC108623183 [Ceratina calcarata]|uniref:Uncharacterized protein LOC108623183 n=1 Tax=Ceratina calcarata TaxID=156304 RepID=A0AAJ7RY64_9HYME|nr:uncharacterized protein LOC108623183 [Ceratina calcarata]
MLPKLNSRNDVVTEKRNPVGEIDREVEKVKSDWRTLRTEGRWIEGKHCANARTKKLYDTLERMTKEIDKIQRSYLAPKSNEFLHRSAVKTLDRPRISFEEKVEKIKDTLFPKAPEKIVDEAFKNVSSDHLKNDLPHEISSKDVHSIRKSNKKSYISDVQVASGKRCTKSAGSQLEDANAIDRINKKKINADVEQYLEKYINEAEKNLVNGKKKSKMKELDISSKDVASMLKKLNINPYDIQYEIMEDQGEENFSLPSAERLRSGRKQNCPRVIVDRKIGNVTVNEKDEQSMLRKNKRNSDTSIQTTTKTNYEENAFIEMGLRTLGNDISRNAMSRVLQSEFLKKDVSLKPM